MFSLWQTFIKYKKGWFKVFVNLIMIFIGMQFIELAYATQYFKNSGLQQNIHVLYAMYLAFIAGLLPNYASIFADEIIQMDKSNLKEILEVFVFFLCTCLLNIIVIYFSLIIQSPHLSG